MSAAKLPGVTAAAARASGAPLPAEAYADRTSLRCAGCGGSGFRYVCNGAIRGYECLVCGTLKGERATRLLRLHPAGDVRP